MNSGLKTMPTALEIVSLYLWGKKNKPSPSDYFWMVKRITSFDFVIVYN